MSGARDELAARKRLLIAQSALHRARLRSEIRAMRSRRTSLVPLAFGLFTLVAGRANAGSWIGKVAGVVAIARTAISIFRGLRP